MVDHAENTRKMSFFLVQSNANDDANETIADSIHCR